MKIQILLISGFDELDVIGPCEVLKMAQTYGADLEVQLLTLSGMENEIVAAHGLCVKTNIGEKLDQQNSDLFLVPGGGWVTRAGRGAFAEPNNGLIPKGN
jgi:putative intracellular protease/amidase